MKKQTLGRLLLVSGLIFLAGGLVLFTLGQPTPVWLAIGACGLADIVAGLFFMRG